MLKIPPTLSHRHYGWGKPISNGQLAQRVSASSANGDIFAFLSWVAVGSHRRAAAVHFEVAPTLLLMIAASHISSSNARAGTGKGGTLLALPICYLDHLGIVKPSAWKDAKSFSATKVVHALGLEPRTR